MAGHSKWANTKHRKAAQDAKKGKIFTRLIREITVAARSGADPESNSRLRTAIHMALNHNMTKDTIERAIKRGIGAEDGNQLEQVRYEGYGPGGVAVIVDCFTDNRTRTVGEVRHAFNKNGGNLGTDGSVAYLFKEQGVLQFAASLSEDVLMNAALDAGAEDIIRNDDQTFLVLTSPQNFNTVLQDLATKDLQALSAEVTMLPSTYVPLSGELAEKFFKMMDALEDLDDVQNVYANASIEENS
jgi:YebC/PmpR family DNA-binding regulatory protein